MNRRGAVRDTIKYLHDYEKKDLYEQISSDVSRHSTRNKAIFLVAKYCALRASEVGLITLNDYYQNSREIYIRRLKGSTNGTYRIVDPVVQDALDQYIEERRSTVTSSNALFISQNKTAINRRTLDIIIKKYCKNTVIATEKRHFHVLRHTRAIELLEHGCSLQDVQWYLGHRDISNTMIYLRFTSKAQEKLFFNLEKAEGVKNEQKENSE